MLKFLKVHWNSGLTIVTALVLALLLAGSVLYVREEVSASAQSVKWFDKVNIAGALTAADGITVTAGGVNFPADSVALGDLAYDVVALGADVVTVCSSGCDYTDVKNATLGGAGSVSTPRLILVAPGLYSFDAGATLDSYEYLIGSGEATTVITASVNTLSVYAGGIYNVTIVGGTRVIANVPAVRVYEGPVIFENVTIIGSDTILGGDALALEIGVASSFTPTVTIWNSTIQGGESTNNEPALKISAGIATIYNSIITAIADDAMNITGAATVALHNCHLVSPSAYAIEISDTGANVDVFHTVLGAGGAESIHVTSGMTATVCLSPMSVALDGSLGNDCTNPANPTIP